MQIAALKPEPPRPEPPPELEPALAVAPLPPSPPEPEPEPPAPDPKPPPLPQRPPPQQARAKPAPKASRTPAGARASPAPAGRAGRPARRTRSASPGRAFERPRYPAKLRFSQIAAPARGSRGGGVHHILEAPAVPATLPAAGRRSTGLAPSERHIVVLQVALGPDRRVTSIKAVDGKGSRSYRGREGTRGTCIAPSVLRAAGCACGQDGVMEVIDPAVRSAPNAIDEEAANHATPVSPSCRAPGAAGSSHSGCGAGNHRHHRGSSGSGAGRDCTVLRRR